jgi:hypothetical protein
MRSRSKKGLVGIVGVVPIIGVLPAWGSWQHGIDCILNYVGELKKVVNALTVHEMRPNILFEMNEDSYTS